MKTSLNLHLFPQNPKQLMDLVAMGEGTCLEFKRKLPDIRKTAKLFCALANTMGGIILVGVTDDKKLHQIHLTTEINKINDALSLITPQVELEWETLPLDSGKKVLMLKVPEGHNRPYWILGAMGKSASIRVLDESLKCPKYFLKILKNLDPSASPPNSLQSRILKILFKSKGASAKEVGKKMNLGQSRAKKELEKMLQTGLVFRTRHGIRSLYRPFYYRPV